MMLRRHSARPTLNENYESSSDDPPRLSSRPMRKKTRKAQHDVIFKVIVVVEVIFLLVMWSFYADRILSSNLWKRDKLPIARTDHHNVHFDPERLLKDLSRERHRREQEARRALAAQGVIREIPENRRGPTLVIGGSDGSGTRAFASIMAKLGVPMRIQDKESFDVHGAEMFGGQGWPPLAKMILNATHSADYELADLSHATQAVVKKEMRHLKDAFHDWQLKVEQKYNVREKMHMKVERASDVAMGFKAPVTMLLLPLLKEIFGSIKFLHVVRDGRDVSLSTNKSPVQKFYQSMYVDADERMNKYQNGSYPVLAMHLWNDWNTQALGWEQSHSNDPDFDYLVMRSEDLLDPSRKFETLARLAAFVGSPKTLKELCCMSQEEDVDMGKSLVSTDVAAGDYRSSHQRLFKGPRNNHKASPWLRGATTLDGGKVEGPKEVLRSLFGNGLFSGGFRRGAFDIAETRGVNRRRLSQLWDPVLSERNNQRWAKSNPRMRKWGDLLSINKRHAVKEGEPVAMVHSRYGKWREKLKDEPVLSAKLHQVGARGLATFGYEPEAPFMDSSTSPIEDFKCDQTVVCN